MFLAGGEWICCGEHSTHLIFSVHCKSNFITLYIWTNNVSQKQNQFSLKAMIQDIINKIIQFLKDGCKMYNISSMNALIFMDFKTLDETMTRCTLM